MPKSAANGRNGKKDMNGAETRARRTFDEEKAEDKKLTEIAETAVNRAASGDSDEGDEAEPDARFTPARPPVRAAELGRGRSARR